MGLLPFFRVEWQELILQQPFIISSLLEIWNAPNDALFSFVLKQTSGMFSRDLLEIYYTETRIRKIRRPERHGFLPCVNKGQTDYFLLHLCEISFYFYWVLLGLLLSNVFLSVKCAEVRVHVHVPLPVGQTSWTSATQWRHEL